MSERKKRAAERRANRKPSKKKESLLYSLWKHSQETASQKQADKVQAGGESRGASRLEQGPVLEVWRAWSKQHGLAERPFSALELLPEGFLTDLNMGGFAAFEDEARQYAEYWLAYTPEDHTPDANVRCGMATDGMTAWAIVFPPHKGGEELSAGRILQKLRSKGVVYGLDGDFLAQIALERNYCRVFIAAQGVRPVHGQDGRIVNCLPNQGNMEVKGKSKAPLDNSYKSSVFIRNISKGMPICTIVPPTEPKSGVNIYGSKVNGRQGRHAVLPKAKNTVLSEDGTQLLAAVNGQVTYEENLFKVEELLVIDSDVDLSVGNLDFTGDVVINGCVRDNFEVLATGNIVVHGMVENAHLHAGGNIVLEHGMNGNAEGILEAGRDITSKFLENCAVYAGGCVYAGSIIGCEVACEDTISVLEGKGIIIGGSCTAVKRIEANIIGSKNNRTTTATIGSTPQLLMERRSLEGKLELVLEELTRVNKDLHYLESGTEGIPAHRQALFKQLKLRRPILQLQERKLTRKLQEISDTMDQVNQGIIICRDLYPMTKVFMGNAYWMSDDIYHNCRIRFANGEIVVDGLRSSEVDD